MKKLKANFKRSKLGLLIRLVCILVLIGFPIFFLSPELLPLHTSRNLNFTINYIQIPLPDISLKTRMFILFITETYFLILAIGLFSVARMLDMFKNKYWFLPNFSKHLTIFGISLIAITFYSFMSHFLLALMAGNELNSLIEYYSYMKDFKKNSLQVYFTITTNNLLLILIGIVLITVAKVLKRASENADELEQIV